MPTLTSSQNPPLTPVEELTKNDLAFIEQRAKRIAKFLRKKYEALGWDRAISRKMRVPEFENPNNITPSMTLHFLREKRNGQLQHEAVIDLDLGVIKPRTKKELAELGLERDPLVRERQLVLNGRVLRPGLDGETIIDNARMQTAPSMGNTLFDYLKHGGFIEAPDCVYIPIGEARPVPAQKPLPRRLVRQLSKLPVDILDRRQSNFVYGATRKLQENFTRRYGPMFEKIDFDVDAEQKTFRLTLRANEEFAGRNPHVELVGSFELVWRNEGKLATALEFKVEKGLLTKKFNDNASLLEPIDIMRRREASMDIFNLLVAAERISTDPVKEFYATERRRAERLHPETRRHGHRAARRAARQNIHKIARNIS